MHSYIKGLMRREGASERDRIRRWEEISVVSSKREERRYQEEKGIVSFISAADGFSNMKVISYLKECFGGQSLSLRENQEEELKMLHIDHSFWNFCCKGQQRFLE